MSDSKKGSLKQGSVEQQIKFAVVMYGGGSLAIYINGVAQELLRLVQATESKNPVLESTTRVYRKIAYLLSNSNFKHEYAEVAKEIIAIRKQIQSLGNGENFDLKEKLKSKIQACEKLFEEAIKNNNPSVHFVIDVLTGSSAGGINAIFLSKALTNGLENINDLQNLWREQGDFALLLNDKKSVADNQLPTPQKPDSLLNSQRMYLELLKALDGMDNAKERLKVENKLTESLVKELDLYVTYTDFKGLPLPMFLSDKTVLERRHKQYFNFRYTEGEIDDFESENNPFLAFAARSTSAFPLAFEPSRLTDIDDVIDSSLPKYAKGKSDNEKWQQYFNDKEDGNGNEVVWKDRSFVDGGALDNKPFGYAIDKITQRTAEGIVRRKLLYIEPDPEVFKSGAEDKEKPNAIENLLAQGSGLPRYETIREDLKRLKDRNNLIGRVKRITARVEADFENNRDLLEKTFPSGEKIPEDWSEVGLRDILEYKGAAFLLYYRLRVSSVTDEIGGMVTSYFRLDEDSDYSKVLRSLINFWRDENYREDKKVKSDQTLNKFLYQYDVDYRFRRIRFVLQKIENLLNCQDQILDNLEKTYFSENIEKSKEEVESIIAKTEMVEYAQSRKQGFVTVDAVMYDAMPGNTREEKQEFFKKLRRNSDETDSKTPNDFVEETLKTQRRINEIYSRLRRENDYLHTSLENSKLAEQLLKSEEYQPLKERVEKLKADFAEVEKTLRRFELQKQIEEARDEATVKRLQEIQRWLIDDSDKSIDDKSAAEMTDDDKSALKKLSFAALERIVSQLKKETENGNNKDCNPIAENECERVLEKAFKSSQQSDLKSLEAIRQALSNAADSLNKVYNQNDQDESRDFLRYASAEMKRLLGINGKNEPVEKDEMWNIVSKETDDVEISIFIRAYLRNYYLLFDSYDQLSFPIYFETAIGEAVEVDAIRISSRDAHSLIKEEDADEKRRKLAGNYLYGFGAFLDPRWRLNDIMWGRLDGSERLIEALLPDKETDNSALREVLIRESNELILKDMLLEVNSDAFKGTLVNALTLASTEAIAQNAVDKLVSGLTGDVIQNGLNNALASCLNPQDICEQVKASYEVDRRLEPKSTLKMLSRATQVGGKILENIAENKAQAGDRLSWIARLGQIFWGLVTVAAPNTIANQLFNYWLQLLYLFEIVVIVGSTILPNPVVQQFGIIAFLATVSIHITMLILHDIMRGTSFLKPLKFFVAILLLIAAGAGVFFFYALMIGKPELWKDLTDLRTNLTGQEQYSKLPLLGTFAILLIALFGWREVRNKNIRQFGWAIFYLSLALVIAGAAMQMTVSDLTKAQTGITLENKKSPIMALEFAGSQKDIEDIVAYKGATVSEEAARGKMKTALFIDSFVFVPLYVLVFLLLSRLLASRRKGWFGTNTFLFFLKQETWQNFLKRKKDERREDQIPAFLKAPGWFQKNAFWLSIIALIITLAAGTADCIENYYSYKIMSISLAEVSSNGNWFDWKTNAAIIKFILTFTAVIFLSFNFYRSLSQTEGYIWQNRGLTLLFLGLWILSLAGIICTVITDLRDWIGIVLLAQIAATFMIAIVLIRFDKKFLKDF